MGDQYFGKYRGVVVATDDPQQQGRIQANVTAVPGQTPSGWALPCTPFTGINSGLACLPAVGDLVWIEFEGGDPDTPIWTGCFWPEPQGMNDGLTLRSREGATLEVTGTTVNISNGMGASITLAGPVVTVNTDALEVT